MTNILFYLHFIKTGGAEKIALEYIDALLEKDYNVDLMIDYDLGDDQNDLVDFISPKVNFFFVKSQFISKLIYYFRTKGKTNRLYNMILYPLVIYFDFYYYHFKVKKQVHGGNYGSIISFYQFLPSYVTNIKKSKHILWIHGSIDQFLKNHITEYIYKQKLKKYDYVVTIANEMRQQIYNKFPETKTTKKVKMIYNGLNFQLLNERANDIFSVSEDENKLLSMDYLCCVSRLDENQKDITTLIKGFELFANNNSELQTILCIIGDGPSFNEISQLIEQKGLKNRIFMVGRKQNPYVWMKHARACILSSKFEGLPTVLIESMAIGTFTISSNCKTGPSEILDNGNCGDLFDVGDYKQLAAILDNIYSDPARIEQKKKNAHERVQMFNKDITRNMIRDLLK